MKRLAHRPTEEITEINNNLKLIIKRVQIQLAKNLPKSHSQSSGNIFFIRNGQVYCLKPSNKESSGNNGHLQSQSMNKTSRSTGINTNTDALQVLGGPNKQNTAILHH